MRLFNNLGDGFEGKLTTSKWATIAKCSPDKDMSAINDLLALACCGNRMRAGAVPAMN